MPLKLDLDTYSAEAERFVTAMDREYYEHFAGHKQEFEIEAIYERHRDLFEPSMIDDLRDRLANGTGDERRRVHYLLELAVGGLMGEATKAEETALAEREATLEIEIDGRKEAYRQSSVVQANEPDPDRRAEIERARLAVLDRELNPLHRAIIERVHELARDLGWESYRAMCEDLKGIDLGMLVEQTGRFTEETGAVYRERVEPQLLRQTGRGFAALRRSDLPYFFRAPAYDRLFPAERLMDAFERTLSGLGIELRAQTNVKLDTEQRPHKSPRAFCAPVHAPDEVYLVIPRVGGRDDFAALFHEGGHTEHYANVDPALSFEFRQLGDNSVTEAFAFLFEHLTEDPHWLRTVLGADDTEEYVAYARACKLVFLRRYAAKLAYELELHGRDAQLSRMPDLYAGLLGDAVGVDWPEVTYLSDVDPGFYAANYLRAWALETHLRRLLEERHGPEWFADRRAGDLLRSLWREGQRLDADELLAQVSGERIDFAAMLSEV
jgi:oligoendopeptidase F